MSRRDTTERWLAVHAELRATTATGPANAARS